MSRKPNILWICTDQQRYDTLGCTGNPFVRTPNIDALAAGGVLLNGMHVQSPVCTPSRASFLTGRYPSTCRVRQNGQDIPASEYLLPTYFRDNGYICGLSGKLHISACNSSVCKDTEPRIDDGYSFFSWSHQPEHSGKSCHTGNAYSNWLLSHEIDYDTYPLSECPYVECGMPGSYSQTTWCFNEAMRFIGMQDPSQPWLFSLNCFDPHHAFDPPAEYLQRYFPMLDQLPLPDYVPGELEKKSVFQQREHENYGNISGFYPYNEMSEKDHRYVKAAYWAMIDQIDDNVGRIVAYLKSIGQYENTLIIFTSDHGESLGDHGIYLKGPYLYETAIHVPFIAHWANHLPAGITRNALVEMIDLAPTLCEVAELQPPVSFQGRSFLNLINYADAPDRHRETVYAEFYNANIKHKNPKAFISAVSDGHWKLSKVHCLETEAQQPCELYDLIHDPMEHNNLAMDPRFTEELLRMMCILTDRMAQTADPLPERKTCW